MVSLQLRNVILGAGAPKLLAPILGAGAEAVIAQAQALGALAVDMTEWRFDACRQSLGSTSGKEGPEAAALTSLLVGLRASLGDMPLLFTYRTEAEQAGEPGCPADYGITLRRALECEGARPDMVDIELARGRDLAASLAAEAGAAGAKALLSLHNYGKTPSAQVMVDLLLQMEDAGAHVAKLAVMPQCPADVLAIFSAGEMAQERLNIPYAIMGMGRLGVLTRMGCGLFGSAFTFGAGASESAPGQPPAIALREAFRLLYED